MLHKILESAPGTASSDFHETTTSTDDSDVQTLEMRAHEPSLIKAHRTVYENTASLRQRFNNFLSYFYDVVGMNSNRASASDKGTMTATQVPLTTE